MILQNAPPTDLSEDDWDRYNNSSTTKTNTNDDESIINIVWYWMIHQASSIQRLTLTSYMCISPDHTYIDPTPGITIQRIAVQSKSNTTITNNIPMNTNTISNIDDEEEHIVEFEEYEVDDDEEVDGGVEVEDNGNDNIDNDDDEDDNDIVDEVDIDPPPPVGITPPPPPPHIRPNTSRATTTTTTTTTAFLSPMDLLMKATHQQQRQNHL